MAIDNNITEIRRLTKVNEGIEQRIYAESQRRAKMLESIARLQQRISILERPSARCCLQNQLKSLLLEIEACDTSIRQLTREMERNDKLCRQRLLEVASIQERIGRVESLDESVRFDWKEILQNRDL
ncbi:hypothetical protein ADIS_4855 [Lunatimonas lonarensis]|uniref:Uncharacterized protein n=1 Tax=Lunatimonas lonarensis TaxID=1232681 RepID=R7ZL36_9BACT|nr:hypothetical protein [Lunatimonas lonarensis]EON74744.1 hypothetical protein ADIS_4855 [Lunatimonas lonarensis]